MKKMSPISIGKRKIGEGYPVYIIAEVGSNFDGDLERAKMLARTAKDMGADAYKIQNFLAPKIVSAAGFEGLKIAHQAKWDKPVVDVYKKAEFPREWVKAIAVYCKKIGIDFLSAPYDYAAVDLLGVKLSGFIGWFVWRMLYLTKIIGFSNRIRIVLDWTLDLLIERSISQLQDHPHTHAK